MDHWEDWQKVYQYGTLVIWPPDQVREVINRQREKYDPVSAAYVEAHITLTQPLLYPLSTPEWNAVEKIIHSFTVFDIQFGPSRSFLPYPCIWYEVQPANKILELRKALHQTGFFNLSLEHTEGFIPHLTITEGQSGPVVDQELLTSIQRECDPGTFICQDVAYIIPDDGFCFGVGTRISLG